MYDFALGLGLGLIVLGASGFGYVAYLKVKAGLRQDIADSDLDDNLNPDLVNEAASPKGQTWDAAP